jgi:HPt (histidine-containing phosphotransfer) domain-containing protein
MRWRAYGILRRGDQYLPDPRCRRAAPNADTGVLSFEGHSMKGGAAVCFALELAGACSRLEDQAKAGRCRFTPC